MRNHLRIENSEFRIQKTAVRSLISVFCLLISVFCLLTTSAFAQTGGVKGKVRNLSDRGIAGATISARQNGAEIKTAKSDAKGVFLLDGLEPGVYNLAFEASGYGAAVQYNVEIKKDKIRDLGNRLILMVDRGTLLIIQGSVFYKDGTSVTGAEVKAEKINADGSTKKLATLMTNISGEFSIRPPDGSSKYRFTAKYKGSTVSKDIAVESAGVYRLAISLDINRQDK